MNAYSIIILLTGHWVGDYLFQTSRMAQQKRRGVKWLTIHVAVYTLELFSAAVLLLDFPNAIYFAGVNAALHWITDFFTSRISAKYVNQPRIFFPVIGFDQLSHSISLIWSLEIFSVNS